MDVRLPDGTLIKNVPDGTTKAQLTLKLQQNGYDISKLEQSPVIPEAKTEQSGVISRVAQGLVRDPLDGAAQLLSHAVPDSVRNSVDAANNWLADKTGMVAKLPEGGLDAQIKQREDAYQASRGPAPGIDLARIVGNIGSAIPMAFIPGAQIQQGKKAFDLANLLRAGLQGGAIGALQPVTQGNFADEKAKQVGFGAAFGAAAQPLASAAGNVIYPTVRPEVRALQNEGITPTPGQILGGGWQRTEDKLMSLPLLGDLISRARERGRSDLNRAAYGRALQGTGVDPATLPIGSEGIDAVKQTVGNQYDSLLPQMSFHADNTFNTELANLRAMAQNLAPNEAARFDRIINQHLSKLSPNGGMQGETYKILESALRTDAQNFSASPDAYQRELGAALAEAGRIFKSGMERSNPNLAQELMQANKNYANYAVLRRAGASSGAPENGFTPAQLTQAVKSSDRSVGKGSTATGNALMQDLASAGRLLESKVPNSGTSDRLFLNSAAGSALGGAGILGYIDPTIAALMAAGALPYTKAGGKITSKLLTSRPANFEQLAESLKLGAPVTGAVIAEQ